MTRSDAERRGGAPEPIGTVLSRIVREVRPRARQGGIADIWRSVAGPELDGQTRPATLQRGVLTVEVLSTSLLAELEGFRRDELLARVVEADPTGRIRGLRFRLGVF